MPDAGRWLVDTNILLRMSKIDDLQYPTIGGALQTLVAQGARLCFTSQTLGEFWHASTRPLDKRGFGLSVADVAEHAGSLGLIKYRQAPSCEFVSMNERPPKQRRNFCVWGTGA